MVDVLAKDDGLGEAVGGLEELGDLGRDNGGAFFENEIPVEVAVVVFAVFNELAKFVALAVLGAPTVEIFVEPDADDFVRSEEAVADSLLEGVGVDWGAEVFGVGDILRFLGRGGEADLSGGREVFEDLPPACIVGGAAAVTLVHDHKIEEVA